MAQQIDGLTNDPKQEFFAVIDGYDSAKINLEWKPNQYGWFMAVTWGTFEASSIRLAYNLNILHQFKNQLPFGIAITSNNQLDPITENAWTTNSQFIVLNAADVETIAGVFNGQ
ncbi:MAG: hypothetical protein EBX40_08805 [Gammaproteobacteria bacterium]|nr:hypothetical protein [Gammaproteobacteria bacterium]